MKNIHKSTFMHISLIVLRSVEKTKKKTLPVSVNPCNLWNCVRNTEWLKTTWLDHHSQWLSSVRCLLLGTTSSWVSDTRFDEPAFSVDSDREVTAPFPELELAVSWSPVPVSGPSPSLIVTCLGDVSVVVSCRSSSGNKNRQPVQHQTQPCYSWVIFKVTSTPVIFLSTAHSRRCRSTNFAPSDGSHAIFWIQSTYKYSHSIFQSPHLKYVHYHFIHSTKHPQANKNESFNLEFYIPQIQCPSIKLRWLEIQGIKQSVFLLANFC